MSAVDNTEINVPDGQGQAGTEDVELGNLMKSHDSGKPISHGIRKPKRLIYFSDGQTMEDPEDDDGDETDDASQQQSDLIENPIEKSEGGANHLHSHPPVDPKTLTWPEWVRYYSGRGGSNVLGGLEYAGETLAYYLGITTPKYQHEIDEYNRIVAKEKAEEAEAKAWQSTNPSTVPIVSDPVKTEDQEASKSLTINADRV